MKETTQTGTTLHTATGPRIEVRRAGERFHTRTDWLNSFHSFSFGPHYDPDNVGFGTLRVLNDDVVAAGRGFGAHPHRDMEIVTWVIQGALAHQDSSGGQGVLRPGEIQTMSAGTGIVHSEANASATEPVHFLQMWVAPDQAGLKPAYAQQAYPEAARRGNLLPVVSNGSIEGTLRIHQTAIMLVGSLETGQTLTHRNSIGDHTHVYLVSGQVRVGDETLGAGAAVRVIGREPLSIEVEAPTELVVWDLQ